MVVVISLREAPPIVREGDALSEARAHVSFKSLKRVHAEKKSRELWLVPLRCETRRRLDESFAINLIRATNAAAERHLAKGMMRKVVGELREDAWPSYQADCGARKGDYADARVFDFATWVQYAAIGRLIDNCDSVDREVGETFLSLLGGKTGNLSVALVDVGFCCAARIVRTTSGAYEFVLEKPANFAALTSPALHVKADLEVKLLRAFYSEHTLVDLETSVRGGDTIVHVFKLVRRQ